MGDEPQIVDLGKSQTETKEDDEEDRAGVQADDYPSGTSQDVYEEARNDYSESTRDELEDETDVEVTGEDEAKKQDFTFADYEIENKLDPEKGFSDLKEGDFVLLSTPLEGAKVGEVTAKEESWTGTLEVKVDTGANEYNLTPYDDDFSEKFVAAIGEEGQLGKDLLSRLGKTTPNDVGKGSQVIIDVPAMGPVRGTVANKKQTESQGIKIDVKAEGAVFTLFEEPTPAQKKEQPMLVGSVKDV